MKNIIRSLFLLLVVVGIGLLTSEKSASADTGFKDGDTIRIIVPFSPGGGYDRACRLIQPFFEKELIKLTGFDVNVIIANITGAGGVRGYSSMFRAKPNGKTVGMVGLAAAPYQQLLFEKFDLGTFTYIAKVNSDPALLVVGKKLPIKSFGDFIKRAREKPMLLATSGKGASENIDALVTKALLKKHGIELNIDFVHYKGSNPAHLGVVKGEAEGQVSSESSAYHLVNTGDLKPIAIYKKTRGTLLPDVLTLAEQNVPGADEMSDVIGMIRVIVAPPGTPAATTKVLRSAMFNALRNPELISRAKKVKLFLDSDTGEVAETLAKKRLETAKRYKKMIMTAFE